MSTPGPTERFTIRVDNYLKYRPHYPAEIINVLQDLIGLNPAWHIADIGVGTGFSAELFLQHGNRVTGIEPNAAMRSAGDVYLQSYPSYSSLSSTAEQTGLSDHSVDLILAGQAFHWFRLPETKTEWQRILRPEGWVALLWNERRETGSPFLVAYEELLLEFAPDYQSVDHRHINAHTLHEFFNPNSYFEVWLPYSQNLDFEGIKGRLLSSSYVPLEDSSLYQPMLDRLQLEYDRNQQDGCIELVYDTKLYIAPLG